MNRTDRFNGRSAIAASCGIAFMAKASTPGRAKTRLVPPLTFDEAAALNTVFLQDVADNVLLAARHASPAAGIAGYAAYGPPGSEDFFRQHLAGRHRPDRRLAAEFRRLPAPHHPRDFCARPRLRRRAQFRQPDLADRAADRDRRSCWRGRATAPCSVRRATAAIICSGSKSRIAACSRISPGAPNASPRRRVNAPARSVLEVHSLPVWYDVDDMDGLRRLYAELGGEELGAAPASTRIRRITPCRRRNCMHRLWREHDFDRHAESPEQVDEMRA